uniref:E3 ubiquitin-protein ligase n=1 Tax=Lutzomyia longipalpis TaxID=7200 RepID=A0A7G3AHS3_LUTLO
MESSQLTAQKIMLKGKGAAAAFINADCTSNRGGHSVHLDILLDNLLDPEKSIDNSETIEWCKWLIAGGRTPSEFSAIVRGFDNHAKCGLVWIPHVVAYRCRTCGISPCMSICRECFKKGDHSTHDFNMFLSQAGGACDCGDTSVMKAEGFCTDHGINYCANNAPVPDDLMSVAEAIMPRLLLRLLQHFRENGNIRAADASYSYSKAANECDEYCSMLMEFNNMGELMRRVMTRALINPELYKQLVEPPFPDNKYGRYLASSKKKYEDAVKAFPSPEPPDEYEHLPALGRTIAHITLLQEFIFWTFKFEFPQNIVCFLLNMLPDQDYKEHLTRTFVMHYSRIPSVLEMSKDPDTLSNRVVHMSVQLFSNESLALKMVEELSLLHVMIISLKLMMSKILILNTLHDPDKNFHFVIDCAKRVMKEHCYWPLVSDFNNVLSHESVALVFLRDDNLIDMWFQFLSMLQGMNVNVRETGSHVEFEPSSYYAAFSCELEASAYPMWSIISHLRDSAHADLAKKIMSVCVSYLQDWIEAINFTHPKIEKNEMMHASFHFPLHRYLAAFTCQAVRTMGMPLKDILPSEDLKLLMMHPLRVQSLFYEILSSIWVRNGLQIKGQAMTYIQANFCNSMVDMDLFFLQLCATHIPAETFLTTAIDVFGVSEWLGMGPLTSPQEIEQDSMLEGLLTFIATLVTSRTNLGNDEPTQCKIEISALLATGDRTHSQLLELMPERSGNAHTRNFENFLKELSVYRPPPVGSENLEQGLFIPVPEVWEKFYDPLHVLLRAVHRRDFQNSMDRFSNYVKQEQKMPKSGNLWPPFRLPAPVGEAYSDPSSLLTSRVFHATILSIFHRAVHSHNVSEHLIALAVFLLEIAVTNTEKWSRSSVVERGRGHAAARSARDPPELLNCYPGDCLSENLRHIVTRVSLTPPEPQVSPANYNTTTFDSDLDWDVSESDTLPMLVSGNEMDYSNTSVVIIPSNREVAVPQDLSIVRPDMNMLEDTSSTHSLPPLPLAESMQAITEYPIRLALPSSREPESRMEVAIRRDLGLAAGETSRSTSEMFSPTNSNGTGMILPFQRVQPVAVPSRNLDVVAASSAGPRRLANKKRQVEGVNASDSDTIVIEESIISLLLKLHSQLSGTLDSFSLEEGTERDGEAEAGPSSQSMPSTSSGVTAPSTSACAQQLLPDSRIGDGPYFIGNVLRKIAKMDDACAANINDIRRKLWPNQRERQAEQRAREVREKEERSKRAKERQQKLMQEFANKQKQFMAMAAEAMDCCDEDEEVEEAREKEYVCIICNRTSPSTESDPIGLVVLVESSSVVGHRRKTSERFALPLSDQEKNRPGRNVRLAHEFNRRTEILTWKFGETSWYLSNNLAWEGGVHVQSCGHHVHLTCHEAYLSSLFSSQRPQNLNVERGEFLCPVCRQLSNSVLPLSPQLDRPTPIVRVPAPPYVTLVTELTTLIMENERPRMSTKLSEAMGRAMEDMTNSTQRKAKRVSPTLKSFFLFVTSIARTNLEAEIIQRGGSLCTDDSVRYKPKRDCIVPLLHVLSVHVRVMIEWPMWQSWAKLCGIPLTDEAPVPVYFDEIIPSLLADPCALMLKFILLAPLHLDLAYFTCIVKAMFNLLYYQVVLQICVTLTEFECNDIMERWDVADGEQIENLGMALAFVLKHTDRCRRLRRECVVDETVPSTSRVNLQAMEQQLQRLCLPFLRIAALLRHHLYHQELPDVASPHLEFVRLVYFLELVTIGMDWEVFNGAKALCFVPGTDKSLPARWCEQFMDIRPPYNLLQELVVNQYAVWYQPRLLQLPREYERLFTYYHEQTCQKCHQVPLESSICLLCGTIVCLKQQCCKDQECCEAVRHSITCGGGTGIFLVVTSTYIIVIRGRRACLWGSLYLDDYDEEDRDLKRGKPLYLSEDRFNLLESQWLSHRFAHTKHTWVWHRDSL